MVAQKAQNDEHHNASPNKHPATWTPLLVIAITVVLCGIIVIPTVLFLGGEEGPPKFQTYAPSAADPDNETEALDPYTPYSVNSDEFTSLLQRFPSDQEFYMVNVFSYRDSAEYADGRATNLTGREADQIYSEYVLSEWFPRIDVEVVFASDIQTIILDTNIEESVTRDWHGVAVVRYPNASAFFTMTSDAEYNVMLEHKTAGLQDTMVWATTLIPETSASAAPPTDALETEESPPVAMFHILDYNDIATYREGHEDEPQRSGREAVGLYQDAAFPIAQAQGVRVAGFFNVKATIIADQTYLGGFDEIRINTFPSVDALRAVITDGNRQSGMYHRAAGLKKTWSFLATPFTVNTLGGNGMTI